MKRTTMAAVALGLGGALAGTVTFAGLAVASPGGTPGPRTDRIPPATASAAVPSASLKVDLARMRDEERLARDVYAALAKQYDRALPFANIVNSEQRHFDAIGTLLSRYGVDDPASGRAAGSYADAELQTLYDDLMAQGTKSLADAYDVGIAIEKEDIADLERIIAHTTETDAKRVFENLLAGSRQHLSAFESAKAGTPHVAGQGLGQGRMNGQGRMGQGYGAGQGNGIHDPANCPTRNS